MQYRKIEKTGESLSTLGFGCMRLPQKDGQIDVKRAVSQIRYAIDNGLNYLDTAWIYHDGLSESFLGQHVLKDGYREKVNIATKLPCIKIDKKEQIQEIFDKQMENLQVDVIDYYLLHALDGNTFDRMVGLGVIDFMNKLKREGKIRFMGFSFHGENSDFKRIIDSYDWDFCQVQFNIIDENYQAGIDGIRYASNKGLGVFVMEPLRGGSLVARIPDEVQKIYDKSTVKHEPCDWALRWIWNHPEVTMVLSGMNEEEHIKSNIETASTSLPNGMSKEELETISNVREVYERLIKVKCTGCKYCMPCPAGINIPSAFSALNNANVFERESVIKRYKESAKVSVTACLDCGKCEKACPQHLPIRQSLKLVHDDIEAFVS